MISGELCAEKVIWKMSKKKIMLILLAAMAMPATHAEPRVLSLEECREMAVENNKELRAKEMQQQAAAYARKSAFTSYLPKVSATGIYMHTGKELSLLSDEQKTTLSGLGDAVGMPALNAAGQAADKRDLKLQELIVDMDETYWHIVALASRKRLADSYLKLVETLDGDMQQMVAEGFATTADGLSVKVKVNEARVAVIQVDNGIELMKMRLCELCGLPLDEDPELADEHDDELPPADDTMAETDAWESRPELSALGTAVRISDEKVKIARAEFLPSVVLTGGYFASYPSVFNSFEKKMKGTWNVGVAVNVPLLTWGDRGYKVKAARAEAAAARLELDETREKIELQVAQSRRKVREARERYAASASSQAEADENLRYATLGFKEGVVPVSSVLEAQTAWLSARSNMVSADIDLRLAHVYLKKSLGTIK